MDCQLTSNVSIHNKPLSGCKAELCHFLLAKLFLVFYGDLNIHQINQLLQFGLNLQESIAAFQPKACGTFVILKVPVAHCLGTSNRFPTFIDTLSSG